MLGSALPAEIGEQPGRPEDSDDFNRFTTDAVHDPERANDQLPDLGLAALRHDAARFRELPQTFGREEQPLDHEVRVQRGVLDDVLLDRLEVSD